MSKEIYTGYYMLAALNGDTAFGGISGRISLPNYDKKLQLYFNEKVIASTETQADDNGIYCNFTLAELEGLHSALEKIINDMRKLEALSKQNLLRDEAYIDVDKV
ncbi:hypothetical protein [Thorsellia anophelis]|nr:hypothetical protein [Thorsellia anophelis]